MNTFHNEFGIAFGMWISIMNFVDTELNLFFSVRILILYLLLEGGLISTHFNIKTLNIYDVNSSVRI
jgi:hypothetical protein